jgi:tetratricopeptide (TPR) repeat protein
MLTDKINKLAASPLATALIIASIVTVFYAGSLKNDTALDDILVLTSNSYVQDGLKGIPDIFSHDSFYGATQKPASRLSWRYRPLSLALLAIIHEFAGDNWPVYHFFSLLLYFLCGWLMYRLLLRWFFREKPLIALTAALAFIILPVHVEVVANIKSMDELLACIFSILFLDQLLTWDKNNLKSSLFIASLFFLAALFSKESSIILAALAPILLFVSSNKSAMDCLRRSLPFILLTAFFLLIRLSISRMPDGQIDITNNPYFTATFSQKLATISVVLLKYLRLLFLPEFLSFDYGYNHIPYVSFSNAMACLSAALHITLLAVSIRMILKRNNSGFFLLAYLTGILLTSNLLFNIGPIMADRFVFVPSFFLIAGIFLMIEKICIAIKKPWETLITAGLIICFIVPAYSMTTARIADWKDNITLYHADMKKVPESYRVLAFNGMEEINLAQTLSDTAERNSQLKYGIQLMWQAYRIYPDYKNMYEQWGIAYYTLGETDSAAWAWTRLKELWPTKSNMNVYNKMIENAQQNKQNERFNELIKAYNDNFMKKDYVKLSKILNEALTYRPEESSVWNLLGRVYYIEGLRDSARFALTKAITLNPANKEAEDLLNKLK